MRRSLKKTITVGAITAATLGTIGAAPAFAGNAPGCVAVWSSKGTLTQTGYARNDCSYTVRIRIDWSFGADGECWTVNRGGSIWSKVPITPRKFNGAANC